MHMLSPWKQSVHHSGHLPVEANVLPRSHSNLGSGPMYKGPEMLCEYICVKYR